MKRDDLRPCVVTIPGEIEEDRYVNGRKKVRQITPDIVFNAFFHMLYNKSCDSVSDVYALVEKEDGTMCCVEPEWIKFTDVG